MPFTLHPFQVDDTDALRALMHTNRSVVYQLPTGGGKSVTAGWIVQKLREKGRRALILVHRKELVRQFVATLKNVGLATDTGVISPSFTPTPWAPIQIASIFSLARREFRFQPDLIIVDEAHHARAKTWATVLERYPEAKILGLTATPSRLDGKGLGEHFEAMHCGPSINQLVADSHLAPMLVKRVPIGFGVQGARKTAGEYNKKDLDERADAKVVGNSVIAYQRYIPGVRTVMFGVTKRHARHTAEALVAAGVRAAYIGDDTPSAVRDATVAQFADGLIDVLCNVSLVDEGFDCPACEAVMDVAHTLSVTRFLQRAGRAMRYREGKTATLLDLVGNTYTHGLPDIERRWSLANSEEVGQPSQGGNSGRALRCCKLCLTVFKPTLAFCPQCGAEHDGRPVSEVDVDLIDATPTPKPEPKPKPAPKMTNRERNRILYEARRQLQTGDPTSAWFLLYDAGRNAGYHPTWAHMLADHLRIPRDART